LRLREALIKSKQAITNGAEEPGLSLLVLVISTVGRKPEAEKSLPFPGLPRPAARHALLAVAVLAMIELISVSLGDLVK